MLKKKRFLIGGVIVFFAIGYLSYTGIKEWAIYYVEVSELGELIEQGSLIYGENVQVNGRVAPGSVEQRGLILRFTMMDVEGEESLPVVYQGVVPDAFKVGNEVIVEGYLNSTGTFQAHRLMPKCPSRYVPV